MFGKMGTWGKINDKKLGRIFTRYLTSILIQAMYGGSNSFRQKLSLLESASSSCSSTKVRSNMG